MKQRIKIFLAGGLLVLTLFGTAMAGPLEDAKAADERGDYATELRILRPLADQGNALAQSVLGWMYAQGRGVTQDNAQALAWYRKAADQGNAFAQTALAGMYAQGLGVAQDYAQAAVWARKAADQGYVLAQDGLGWMYASGHGVTQDNAQALSWYRKAADQGSADAQHQPRVDVRQGPRRSAGLSPGHRLAAQGRRPGDRGGAGRPRQDVS